jgi:hypothetical protein
VKPITAFSGVRISWLMRDRNSLLARLASSAACLSRSAWSASRWRVTSLWTPTRRRALPSSRRSTM